MQRADLLLGLARKAVEYYASSTEGGLSLLAVYATLAAFSNALGHQKRSEDNYVKYVQLSE